jgi:TPR repeat protein
MAISAARKRFRVFLGVCLLLSLGFFSAAVVIYAGVRTKAIKVADVAPTLFQIDIAQHQILASVSSDDERLKIAKSLYQKGVFSRLYMNAGDDMILDLAQEGHAASQKAYADIIYSRMNGNPNRLTLALEYYRKSADQGYEPARLRLAGLTNTDTMVSAADALRPQ